MEEYQSEFSDKDGRRRTVSEATGSLGEIGWLGKAEGGLLGYHALQRVSIFSSLPPSLRFETTLV